MLQNLNPQRLTRKYLLRPGCVRKTHEVPHTAERGRDCGKPVCFGARTGSWEFARSSFLPAQSLPSCVMLGKSLPCWGLVLLLCKIRALEKMIFLRDPSSGSDWLKQHNSGHCRIWLQWTIPPNPGVHFSFHLKAPNNTIPSLAGANRQSFFP